MTRRTIGLILILALLVSPLAAEAQPLTKVPRIGVLLSGSPPAVPDWKERSLLLQELRRLGWREGENTTVEYRWAAGRTATRGADLAAELVRLNVDVIIVDTGSLIRVVQQVQQATTTIPVVMCTSRISEALAVGE